MMENDKSQLIESIQHIIGEKLDPPDDLAAALRSGVVLCKLINKIMPGTISHININPNIVGQMENIGSYLKACWKLGVENSSMLTTNDIMQGKDLECIAKNLRALLNFKPPDPNRDESDLESVDTNTVSVDPENDHDSYEVEEIVSDVKHLKKRLHFTQLENEDLTQYKYELEDQLLNKDEEITLLRERLKKFEEPAPALDSPSRLRAPSVSSHSSRVPSPVRGQSQQSSHSRKASPPPPLNLSVPENFRGDVGDASLNHLEPVMLPEPTSSLLPQLLQELQQPMPQRPPLPQLQQQPVPPSQPEQHSPHRKQAAQPYPGSAVVPPPPPPPPPRPPSTQLQQQLLLQQQVQQTQLQHQQQLIEHLQQQIELQQQAFLLQYNAHLNPKDKDKDKLRGSRRIRNVFGRKSIPPGALLPPFFAPPTPPSSPSSASSPSPSGSPPLLPTDASKRALPAEIVSDISSSSPSPPYARQRSVSLTGAIAASADASLHKSEKKKIFSFLKRNNSRTESGGLSANCLRASGSDDVFINKSNSSPISASNLIGHNGASGGPSFSSLSSASGGSISGSSDHYVPRMVPSAVHVSDQFRISSLEQENQALKRTLEEERTKSSSLTQKMKTIESSQLFFESAEIGILEKIIRSRTVGNADADKVDVMLDYEYGRKCFVNSLDYFLVEKNTLALSERSFNLLVHFINKSIALGEDVVSAKILVQISNKLCKLTLAAMREYMKDHIDLTPVAANMEFWERYFWDELAALHRENGTALVSDDARSNIDPEIVITVISSFATMMIKEEVTKDRVYAFILEKCVQLQVEQVEPILQIMGKKHEFSKRTRKTTVKVTTTTTTRERTATMTKKTTTKTMIMKTTKKKRPEIPYRM